MRHTGGKQAHAGEALVADELAALGFHPLLEIVVEVFESGCHAVEVDGQLGEFERAFGVDAAVEPAGGDALDGELHPRQRPEDGAILRDPDDHGDDGSAGQQPGHAEHEIFQVEQAAGVGGLDGLLALIVEGDHGVNDGRERGILAAETLEVCVGGFGEGLADGVLQERRRARAARRESRRCRFCQRHRQFLVGIAGFGMGDGEIKPRRGDVGAYFVQFLQSLISLQRGIEVGLHLR